MLDSNDGSEFPLVHGEHKPTEFVKNLLYKISESCEFERYVISKV